MEYEYYLIGSDGNPDAPLLNGSGKDAFLFGDAPVKIDKPIRLSYRPPVPKKPCMIDYHSMPDSVVSRKICNVLEPINIKGIQLVPAVINGKDDDLFEDYWIIYIYNRIACMDMERSVYETNRRGKIINIERLFLSRKALAEIPLEDRLVFSLKEDISFCIYHKSVVEAIMSVNPEGVMFYPIEEWYEGIQFEQFK